MQQVALTLTRCALRLGESTLDRCVDQTKFGIIAELLIGPVAVIEAPSSACPVPSYCMAPTV